MCETIRFNNGHEIGSVRTFQDHFKVDATKFGFDGNEDFLDCCLCAVELEKFFETLDDPKFQHENGDWWEI